MHETNVPTDYNKHNDLWNWICGYDIALNGWLANPYGYHNDGAMRIFRQELGAMGVNNQRDSRVLAQRFDY